MHPILFHFLGFALPTYGVLVALGLIVGLWVTTRLAGKAGLPVDEISNLVIYCALAGIAGAKIAMFFFDFDFYRRNPGEIFSLSTLQAGGVFQGGLLAAVITAWIYMRRRRLPPKSTADVFAPGIAIGHALGRIGCFMAGCCYGIACDRPWAVVFTNPEAHAHTDVTLGVPLHPTQLYEAAAEAAIFGILMWRIRKPHGPGGILGLYLVLYSAARFVIEFYRFHEQSLPFGLGLSITQYFAIGFLLLGLWLIWSAKPATPPPESEAS